MSGERGVSENELLMWIERAGDAAQLEDIGRRLALDPELEVWARGARTDREAVMALGRSEAGDAPRGLWRDAVAEAERRALLIEEDIASVRGPYKFRVTPVRLVAAAAFLIVASLGSIAPFLIGSSPNGTPNPLTHMDEFSDAQESVADRRDSGARERMAAAPPALREETETRSLAAGLAERDLVTAPQAVLASSGHGWAADPNGIVAGRAMAGLGFQNMSVMEPTKRALPGAFPAEWGMSIGEAQRVASDGSLVVHISARDVDAYVQRLLAAVGRRGRVVETGLPEDLNGISAPVEVRLTVPVGKLPRALRVCAIEAIDLRLTRQPAVGRPGAWATDRLWWSGTGGEQASVRVVVSPR